MGLVHDVILPTGGSIYPATIDYSALAESGFTSTGAVATDATIALGWKPTTVSTAYPLYDTTNHYLLTIRKVGTTVTVWKQDVELGSYTTSATTYAELMTEALTTYAGAAKGYVSRLVVVESALDFTSFYRLSALVAGLWVPSRLTGLDIHTLLDFANAADLGHDSSGNGHDWTLTGASQSGDTPTNNCSLWNAIESKTSSLTYSNGNKSVAHNLDGREQTTYGDMYVTTGKWYMEFTPAGAYSGVGIISGNKGPYRYWPGNYAWEWGYNGQGYKRNSGGAVAYADTFTTGDIISVLLDADTGTLSFWKNGVDQGVAWSGLIGPFALMCGNTYTSYGAMTANFGATDFIYNPPSGFLPWAYNNDLESNYILSGEYIGSGDSDGTYVGTGCALSSVTINGTTYNNDGTDSSVIVFTSTGFKMVSTTNNASGVSYPWTGTLKYPSKTSNAQ